MDIFGAVHSGSYQSLVCTAGCIAVIDAKLSSTFPVHIICRSRMCFGISNSFLEIESVLRTGILLIVAIMDI
jgi:hypothetical protein